MQRARFVLAILAALAARPVEAAYHAVRIDEVMTSYGGDPDVQFIEMRMLETVQNFVSNSVFAAFDDTGAYIGDILVVPGDVANSAIDTRWIIGTSAFQTASGLAPDFIMPAGILPTGGGMVCYGGGATLLFPEDPPDWDRNDFLFYRDCVAYGTYAGSSNAHIGTPTTLVPDGHSLQRLSDTNDSATDWSCADPATPQNNSGASATMAATELCGACPGQVDAGCAGGFDKGLLLVKESPAGKEKVVVKLIKGPALTQTDLGNPLSSGGTGYALCIYDHTGSLAGEIEVDQAGATCEGEPCWSALGGDPPDGSGYKYKDGAGTADGIAKMLYKGGAAGKSKSIIKGKGANLPDGIAAALAAATSVTVQVRGSDAPECLSVTLGEIVKQESDFFKAK